MSGIGPAPVGSMAMKDVRALDPWAAHGRRTKPRVAASPRSMVPAGRVGWLRCGSSYWRRGCKAPWCRAGVTQKRLDHANIDILLEEVRGEAVALCRYRHKRHSSECPIIPSEALERAKIQAIHGV